MALAKPALFAALRPDADSLLARSLAGILKSPKATIAAVVCILLILTAVFGPALAPQDPYDLSTLDIMDSKLPPGAESMSGATLSLIHI